MLDNADYTCLFFPTAIKVSTEPRERQEQRRPLLRPRVFDLGGRTADWRDRARIPQNFLDEIRVGQDNQRWKQFKLAARIFQK